MLKHDSFNIPLLSSFMSKEKLSLMDLLTTVSK